MTASLAYITWNCRPHHCPLGPLLLRWYGVLFAAGFVISSFVITDIFQKEDVRPCLGRCSHVLHGGGHGAGGAAGSRFFYDWPSYREHPWEILKIWHGGLASHGATVVIPLAVIIFSYRNKFDYLWVLDRIVITVAIGRGLHPAGQPR
ncbi:MAG: prolipoprotein diacylglyceryl transferase family protein [Hymenobacter sp.]